MGKRGSFWIFDQFLLEYLFLCLNKWIWLRDRKLSLICKNKPSGGKEWSKYAKFESKQILVLICIDVALLWIPQCSFSLLFPVCEESPQLGASRPYNEMITKKHRCKSGKSNTHKPQSTSTNTHTSHNLSSKITHGVLNSRGAQIAITTNQNALERCLGAKRWSKNAWCTPSCA